MVGEGKLHSEQIWYKSNGQFLKRDTFVHLSFTVEQAQEAAAAAILDDEWQRKGLPSDALQLWKSDPDPNNKGGIIIRTYKV